MVHETTQRSPPKGMRRDWISSCFDDILSLLGPGGVGSGSIYTIKPSSTPPLVDKVEAEAVASSTPSTSTFQVLLGWINSMISMEKLSNKIIESTWNESARMERLFLSNLTLSLPQEPMMITFLQSDQGVIS